MGDRTYDGTIKLSDIYFDWLYKMVAVNGHYRTLCSQLFGMEFTFLLPKDQSRQSDGRDLRAIFCDENGVPVESLDVELNTFCSVFEMLLALARRIDSDVMYEESKGNRTADWFFRMINNLGLSFCTDENWTEKMSQNVDFVVKKWLARDIDDNGNGGIFPLTRHTSDQRRVEIWYQMQSYLMEKFPI